MKLSALKIDAGRIETGAWVGGIPEMGDLRLKVRGMSNKDAVRLRGKLIDAVPRAQRVGGRLDPDVADAVNAQVMAEAVLLDWANLLGDDGTPIPFSPAKALEILSDPDMAIFSGAVAYAAGTLAEAQGDALEADAKNSGTPSPGASNGATGAAS